MFAELKKEVMKAIVLKYKINLPVILSSGEKSDHYYDVKSLLLSNKDWIEIEDTIIDDIRYKFPKVTCVVGYGIGGILFAMRIANYKKFNISPIIIRKEKKNYGLLKQVEAYHFPTNNDNVIIVDDVCTTGKNFLAAKKIAVANKIKISGYYTFLKRRESNFNCEFFMSM